MKLPIAIFLLLAALPASASHSFELAVQRRAPSHPSMYSFTDLYRLTVSGSVTEALPVEEEAAELPVRVAAQPAARASSVPFALPARGEPSGALTLLAGLAAAAWVARRRLSAGL